MGKLQDKLSEGKPVLTAEITPPKGAGIKKLLGHAELLAPVVDAINVTDCQRALVKMSSLATCKILLDHGFEPVLQMTCRDRNSIALQSDLLGAHALGIENLLCLTGDPVKVGDCAQAKPVFEVETVRLLEIVAQLQKNRDWNDNKMNKRTSFYTGAVVNPSLRSKSQITRMKKKIDAGAKFFQTQANYDLDDYEAFLKETADLGVKILAGVLILPSFHIAKYIHENIPGILLPESVLSRFENSKDPKLDGIQFAAETMARLKPYCAGFHLMTVRTEELIPKVVEYHDRHYA